MAKNTKPEPEGIIVEAAKVLGQAAGKVAKLAGVHPDKGEAARTRAGKLPKKNKQRLPRRVKKAQLKTTGSGRAR